MTKDIDAFLRWLQIREEWGHELRLDAHGLRVDAEHSALLARLLEGKEPLPEPPPCAFSRPWHCLLETGQGRPMSVHEMPMLGSDVLVINNSAGWAIERKIGDKEWIARYRVRDKAAIDEHRRRNRGEFPDPIPRRLSDSRWHVWSEGPQPGCPGWFLWRIERVDENVLTTSQGQGTPLP